MAQRCRHGYQPADRLRSPAGPPNKPSPARIGGQTLTIGANSKEQEGAWQFIQYYMSPASQLEFAKAGVMPSRVSTYDDKFFKDDPAAKDMQQWTDYAKKFGAHGKDAEGLLEAVRGNRQGGAEGHRAGHRPEGGAATKRAHVPTTHREATHAWTERRLRIVTATEITQWT